MIDASKQLICAIDTSDRKQAVSLITRLQPHLRYVKLGLEYFCMHGPDGVKAIRDLDVEIFLDLKLHDIPNTVAGAIRSLIQQVDVFMLTVHASGGKHMLKAAVDAAEETAWRAGRKKPIIVGVTALTSLDTQDIRDIGIIAPIADHIVHLARLAKSAGLDGVVAPNFEIVDIKKECGQQFKIIVPGIRPASFEGDDQKRTATPAQAINQGADFIVVGRPITRAPDPEQALKTILHDISVHGKAA